MVRCDEFYRKWDKCGNFCEKHPDTAEKIDRYLDQINEIEEIIATECKADSESAPMVADILSERACRPLIRENDKEIRIEAVKQIVKLNQEKKSAGKPAQVTGKEVSGILAKLHGNPVDEDAMLPQTASSEQLHAKALDEINKLLGMEFMCPECGKPSRPSLAWECCQTVVHAIPEYKRRLYDV